MKYYFDWCTDPIHYSQYKLVTVFGQARKKPFRYDYWKKVFGFLYSLIINQKRLKSPIKAQLKNQTNIEKYRKKSIIIAKILFRNLIYFI